MIGRLTFRLTRRGAVVWGFVFGLVVVGSARGYVAAYPSAADRQRLAASFGANAGVQALLGVPHRIDTVGGFTAWRSLGVLSIVGAVWGLMAATRALRGEEDAGRWELLVAGPVTPAGATASALAGLALSVVVLAGLTAVVSPLGDAGISVPSYLFLAVALAMSPALFLAVGALASQLAGTRRQAAMVAAGVFGVWYLLRLVADSSSSAGWLRWTTPLGWIEELRPMAGGRPALLLPLGALLAALVTGAVVVADRRDHAAGVLPSRDSAPPRVRLLTGPLGLAVRLTRGAAVAWAMGLGVAAFVFGLVAKAAAEATSSAAASQLFERLGARRAGADAYLGVTFLVLGTVLALAAAAQAAAARDEEASGRLDHLLVRPVRRAGWLAARGAVATAEMAVVAVLAGLAGWAGTATQGTPLPLGRAVSAGVNLVPAALLVLGAGLLLFGAVPRATVAGTYGIVAWSFVIQFVASLLDAPGWLLDLSVFHHVALAPAVNPHWTSAAVMVVVGLAAGAAGAAAFQRRDIVPA